MDVFKALSDPSRRELLDRLNERNGQTLTELCEGLGMSRQAVSKHLAVLEAAGVVTTLRRGREKLHHLDAAPINAIADRWLSRYDRSRAQALADLTTALESTNVTSTTATTDTARTTDTFVYTSYIAATPERVWAGLTDPAFTRRYWNLEFITDWQPGSPMVWINNGVRIEDPEQRVLEAEPFTRLSYTWHTFTPELAERFGWGPEADRLAAERRSRATFTIEPVGDGSRLTVLHEGLEPGGTVVNAISGGWPIVISALKTLLETDELPMQVFRR
jgi:DNA-binding transcriptional ArsR family regulator/uncharacterized protein YndB with AHSA1/START domain